MKTEELTKVTINIFSGDRETIQRFYPDQEWSTIARAAIHTLCERLLSKEAEIARPNSTGEVISEGPTTADGPGDRPDSDGSPGEAGSVDAGGSVSPQRRKARKDKRTKAVKV